MGKTTKYLRGAPKMSQDVHNQPTPRATRPKSRLRRWTSRLVPVVVIAYLAACLVVYLIQNWIIFPGAYFHGRENAQVQPDVEHQIITLHAPDGHRVTALFGAALDPDGAPRHDAARCQTILYFYGNGDCLKTSLGIIDAFRRMGVNVLSPEYVGYPMSGGKPSEEGLYSTANAAWAYLQTRPDVDRRQILLVGRSLGCAAAIDLASREPVEGLATFSAFTTLDEMARKMMPIFPTGLFLQAHFNNENKIARVKCPIFLAHGTRDDFVPYGMMGRLAARATAPHTVYPIQGADHNNIFVLGGSELIEKLAEFVRSLHPVK
jgi:hypothetical protein